MDVVDVGDDEFAAGLRASGLPEPAVELITSFGASTRAGHLGKVTGTVADLTGSEPRPLSAAVRAALGARPARL